MHDALCAAYLVRPDIVTTQHLRVTVDTASPLTVGRTVIDTRPNAAEPPNAHQYRSSMTAVRGDLPAQPPPPSAEAGHP